MAEKLVWGLAWHGWSYDLGKITIAELWPDSLSFPAISLYALLAFISGAYALFSALNWEAIVWHELHRFILHRRRLYKMRRSASLWERIHFNYRQDQHKLEVLFEAPVNTISTMLVITGPIGYVISGWSGATAAFSMVLITTCVYEFFYCTQRLNYKPKTRFVQKLKHKHLLHQSQSKTANMGIVSFLLDKVFRSFFKTTKDCPKSPTMFNLGYDLKEAKRYPKMMELTGPPQKNKPTTALETKPEQAG